MGSLDKRYNRSATTDGGRNVFDMSKVDREVSFFKQKEGKNFINIIPYKVSSKNHPLVADGTLSIGDYDYTLELWVHTYIGPNNATLVCPKRNYGKPCPICEASDQYKADGKEKESSAYWAKKKMYYNVQDVQDTKKGIQLFETNFKYFEKPLRSLAKDTDDGTPFVDFADIKKGKTLKFSGEKEKFDGKDFIQFANMKFVDRDESIEDIADDALPLDSMITVHSYDNLLAIITGGSVEDEDDDEPPTKPSKPKHDEDDDDKPAKSPPKDDDEKTCPNGYKWGKEWGDHPECKKATCPKWKECGKDSD